MANSRIELTARGRLCLILLHLTAGAAWLTADDNARLAASMLAAPFLVDLLYKLLRAPRLGLWVSQRRTQAGATFIESLTLENLARHGTAHGLAIGEPRTQTIAGGAYVARLAAGGRQKLRLSARSRRRGRIAARTFVVESGHPLGMLRWRTVLAVRAEMITEPMRAPLSAELLRALESGRDEHRPGGRPVGPEYFCLREYHHGEDARHVQARRSASLGFLVSKVYRGRREPECSLVLDLRRAPGMPPAIDLRRLEHGLGLAASLCDELVGRGAKLRCFALDGAVRGWQIDSTGDAREFLTYLAGAQSVPHFPLAAEALAELRGEDGCFWIPAGGHQVTAEAARFTGLRIIHAEAS